MGWQSKGPAKAGAKGKAKAKAKASARNGDAKEKLDAKAKQKALQAISETIHLKHFSSMALNSTVIDGKSLVEYVTADKLKVLMGEGPPVSFGATYFRKLALKYRGDADPASQLKSSKPHLPLRESLVEALVAWSDTDKNKGLMMEWMSLTTQECSDK